MPMIIDGTNGLTFPDNSRQYNGYFGFKNRIINGDMRIDQRNNGASVTPTGGGYSCDRWKFELSQASKLTAQRSTIAPSGFINSQLVTSSSAYSVLTGDYFALGQLIEGLNVADLAWGTASAQTVTLSFQVRSSLTGTFGGAISNSAQNRSYPFTYTINAANTYETKTITIPGDTSGTWLTDTGVGIRVYFGLGAGATYSGTAGAWAASALVTATGATSVVGTNGATFYITGVQLEEGVVSTNFDVLPYTTQLQLCQRYFAKTFPQTVAPASNLGSYYSAICATGCVSSAFGFTAVWKLPVEMRAAPSLVTFNPFAAGSGFTSAGTGNFAVSVAVVDTGAIALRSSDSTAAGAFLAVNATASAEL